jgi:hypothetical protein
VYISGENDGFNRNVIMSRFPFADLNGDGKSTYADIATVTAHLWAPGGDGGIRGFAFAELDLPAATYQGNLVVGNAHLKSGGTTSDAQQRLVAAQNVSYYVRHFYNGGGTASVDPFAKIADSPVATSVLPATTPVVLGGDWNEDELGNGTTRGPAEWLAKAQTVGGTSDGVDRDGSDAAIDGALHWSTGSDASFQNGSKLDYVVWQDSIATLRNQGIFISGSNSAASQPAEIAGFAGGASGCSSAASDHRMVYVDLRLPIVDCNHRVRCGCQRQPDPRWLRVPRADLLHRRPEFGRPRRLDRHRRQHQRRGEQPAAPDPRPAARRRGPLLLRPQRRAAALRQRLPLRERLRLPLQRPERRLPRHPQPHGQLHPSSRRRRARAWFDLALPVVVPQPGGGWGWFQLVGWGAGGVVPLTGMLAPIVVRNLLVAGAVNPRVPADAPVASSV